MVRFEAGTYSIGTAGVGPGLEWEQPVHSVKLTAFRMDATEVTVAAYQACVAAGACSAAGLADRIKTDYRSVECTWGRPGLEQDPIDCVTWDEAVAYCHWAGKELPTQEQWEVASRGSKGRDFPWGMGVANRPWGLSAEKEDQVGCSCRRPNPTHTCPIGTNPASDSPEGVKDLATNVSEWTSSPLCPYSKPDCGETARVIKGGACINIGYPQELRGAFRLGRDPKTRATEIGFRCAASL